MPIMSNDMSSAAVSSQNALPVLSIPASQSLGSLATSKDPISTGVTRLDKALANSVPGGLLRGQVTEVYGPPGVGKTSLALNVASNALRDGGKVVWIDTSSPLPAPRLQGMIKELELTNFIYFRTPSLPHLMALLAHPPKEFPPPDTFLLIIDSVSSLFPSYFPNAVELKDRLEQGKLKDKSQLQWLLNRKWNVASDLGMHLARLAARGIAVLAINQTHTRIKGQPRATLYPLLAGGSWENNVQTRVAMYRDLPDLRIAEITKRGGRISLVRTGEFVVSFQIQADGLYDYQESKTSKRSPHPPKPSTATQPTPTRKRKAQKEIADSQDEDSDEEFDWDGTLFENKK